MKIVLSIALALFLIGCGDDQAATAEQETQNVSVEQNVTADAVKKDAEVKQDEVNTTVEVTSDETNTTEEVVDHSQNPTVEILEETEKQEN